VPLFRPGCRIILLLILILGTLRPATGRADEVQAAAYGICINEFMAVNKDLISDEDGDYDDWIEIYNAADRETDLGGFYISDHKDNPLRWQIPEGYPQHTTVPPRGFLVLWADEETKEGPLHLGFKLSSNGESIILTAPDQKTVVDRIEFGSQPSCASYGRIPDGGKNWRFFIDPKAGAGNQGLSFASMAGLDLYQAYTKNKIVVHIITVFIFLLLLMGGMLYYSRLKLKKVSGEQALLLDNIQTQEKKLEKLLVEYETIFNKTQDIIFLVDVGVNDKFTFRRLNPAGEKITGLPTAGVKGKTPVEVFGEIRGSEIEANYRKCLLENRVIFYREEMKSASGEKFYHVRLSPVTLDQKVVQLIETARDITDLVTAQKELAEKEKRYRNLVENINDVIFTVDRQGSFTYLSSNIKKLSGYNREELLGKTFAQLIHPDDCPLLQASFKQIFKHDVETTEIRITTRAGLTKYVRVSGRLGTKKDKPAEITGSMIDISEKKKAELKLREYATYDSLTGVYNRRAGLVILEENKKITDRENSVFSICYVDVNNLKIINDNYGHQEGDRAIVDAIEVIKNSIRDADVICRMGGDEFLLIFPGCSLIDAEIICARFENSLKRFNSGTKNPYQINISIGLAEYRPSKEISLQKLISIADQRMYQKKPRLL